MTFSGFGSVVLRVFLLDFLVDFVVLGVFMVGLIKREEEGMLMVSY